MATQTYPVHSEQFLANGQSLLDITLETGYVDLAEADTLEILYKKPDGTMGHYDATIEGTKVKYSFKEGDIDQEGTWEFRSYIIVSGRDAEGEPYKVKISKSIKTTT